MNLYPQDWSILILNNCQIHKTNTLCEIVEAHGIVMVFLLPYSPDYNPIEESFSCGTSSNSDYDFIANTDWIQ
jgi:transposase